MTNHPSPASVRDAITQVLAEREQLRAIIEELQAENSHLKEQVAIYDGVIRDMQETALCHGCGCERFGSH